MYKESDFKELDKQMFMDYNFWMMCKKLSDIIIEMKESIAERNKYKRMKLLADIIPLHLSKFFMSNSDEEMDLHITNAKNCSVLLLYSIDSLINLKVKDLKLRIQIVNLIYYVMDEATDYYRLKIQDKSKSIV